MAKRTKVFLWAEQATAEDWIHLEQNLNSMTPDEFKKTYLFTKAGVKPYLDRHNGINPTYTASGLTFCAPSTSYAKYSLQFTAGTYNQLIRARDSMQQKYGWEARYCYDLIISAGIESVLSRI